MATKNPIGNYLEGGRMDRELSFEELFLAKTPFYKTAAKWTGKYVMPIVGGITVLMAAPDFDAPKHTSKQATKQDGIMDTLKSAPRSLQELLTAVAQAQENGTRKVYIDRCLIGGDIPEGKYQNADQMIPREIAKILKRNKINVITDPKLIDDRTIVVGLTLVYTANDHSMDRISEGYPFHWDSIKITADYDNVDYSMDPSEVKLDWRAYPDSILSELGTKMSDYLGQIFAMEADSKPARPQTASRGAPDEIREGNIVWKKAIGLGENAKKDIMGKNQKVIDMIKRTGIEIKYSEENNEFYYRKLN